MPVIVQINEADFCQVMFLDTDMDSCAIHYEFIAESGEPADYVKTAEPPPEANKPASPSKP